MLLLLMTLTRRSGWGWSWPYHNLADENRSLILEAMMFFVLAETEATKSRRLRESPIVDGRVRVP